MRHDLASVSVWADELFLRTGGQTELAVARVLRAVLLASIKGETKRLQKMEESARLLLEESKYSTEIAAHTGFESLDDNESGRCTQPFEAYFHVHARDLWIRDRTEVARQLLEAAMEWPKFWEERGHKLPLGHETLAQLAARKTATNMEHPLRHAMDPEIGIPRVSLENLMDFQEKLVGLFERTPRENWSTEAHGRAVVLLLLETLGIHYNKRKNFFSFLDKSPHRPPGPSGEGST
jgi:hypothetical protein